LTSKFINSEPNQLSQEAIHGVSIDERRQQLKQWMQHCRIGTLKLFEEINYDTFCRQVHPAFSPAGWHLGHIAYTEALWLLERCAMLPPQFPEYRRLFVADGLPKAERVKLPTLEVIHDYLDTVRTQVFKYLETADLDQQERLWRWLLQHESQHSETITFVLQLQRWPSWSVGRELSTQNFSGDTRFTDKSASRESWQVGSLNAQPDFEMIQIPGGEFEQGNASIDALDNERLIHRRYLDTYWIDRYPVTCGQYRVFMEAGGYQNPNWWSASGWKWLQENPVNQPLYWADVPDWDNHPVCGVSWYEAEAYARFAGKRLPTEAEWEKATSWDATALYRRAYPWGEATPDVHLSNHDNTIRQTTPVDAYPAGQSAYGLYDTLGNVWEWTSCVFNGYEGFASYPYPGYSKVYFDGQHYVLRGGSWATRPWALRSSFRNWYHPGVRQILAGFRCARSAKE
jgi:ergothioneine biosynthesis protein EgtB